MTAAQPSAAQSEGLKAHVQALTAGLPALVQAVADELNRQQLASPLQWRHLSRADQLAVQTVLGTAQNLGAWAPRLQSAFEQHLRQAVVQTAPTPANQLRVEKDSETSASAGPEGFKMASGIEALALRFSLKDEGEVEQDIELSRLIQQLESKAEAALRELRPLSAALRGRSAVTDDAPLLHPQACAAALASAVKDLPLSEAARLCCLRALAQALPLPMVSFYANQTTRLREMGVTPVGFKVLPSVTALPRGGVGSGTASGAVRGQGSSSQAGGELGSPAGSTSAIHVLARLVAQARTGGQAEAETLDPQSAAALMQQLLASVGDEVQAGSDMRQVFARLAEPGLRLAERDPALWQQHDHPWWLMLDRLLALCSVLDDVAGPNAPNEGPRQTDLATQCEAVLTQFEADSAPHSNLCLQLLTQLDAFGATPLGRGTGLGQAATANSTDTANADDADEEDDGADGPATELASLLRQQMAEQLRQSQAPASVRRFLLGPWITVLERAMAPQQDPQAAQRYSDVVDQLLGATSGQPADDGDGNGEGNVLDVVTEGLSSIGMSELDIDRWCLDLTLRMSDGRAAMDLLANEQAQAWRHDELPTVPVDLHGSVRGARARRDREAWLSSLRPGDICRLFVDAQWQTLRLQKIDDEAETYLLQGRDASTSLHLTRGALTLMRNEGLATTVEVGAFIARAMDSVSNAWRGPGAKGSA